MDEIFRVIKEIKGNMTDRITSNIILYADDGER